MTQELLRSLPGVDALATELRLVAPDLPRPLAVSSARSAVIEARAAILGGSQPPAINELVARAQELAALSGRPSLVRVINATGVILHTNLGRAPLSERAIASMRAVAGGYSNLEFDLAEGARGSRHDHARTLIQEVTGAEDALVVNNNAAALFMVLQALAAGREVIVSRGQAVEIGGGFRIPDVVRQSGAEIVEVGTTNRTYVRDYAARISDRTRAILRVHASNFRVVGFTAAPAIADLATLAKEQGILLVDDLGSGALIDTARFGMAHEPTVQESVAAGVHLTLFSGDKLLGGPQCGIIAGRADLVSTLRSHPLARALRVDKMTFAALNATLSAYANGRECEEIPVWRMLSTPLAQVKRRAQRWARAAGDGAEVAPARSVVGGGSLPEEGVASWLASVPNPAGAGSLAARLRGLDPPIIARISADRVLLDPRTVDPKDDRFVEQALRR